MLQRGFQLSRADSLQQIFFLFHVGAHVLPRYVIYIELCIKAIRTHGPPNREQGTYILVT